MKNPDIYKDLLPSGALPIMGLRVLSYIDKEGTVRFDYRPDGDVLITQVIGTLYWVLQDLTDKARKLTDEI